MYTTVKYTRKFDTDNASDVEDYNDILNDALCTIIHEKREKLTEVTYEDAGSDKPMQVRSDKILIFVTWQRKELL